MMPVGPGSLSPEEEQRWVEDFRLRAAVRWGDERAADIAATLGKTAHAVGVMMHMEFSHDEMPGFYLPPSETEDGWRVQ
ncbi:MAG: hypothetical protein WD333_10650 [Dehalococcoidia bacterium]